MYTVAVDWRTVDIVVGHGCIAVVDIVVAAALPIVVAIVVEVVEHNAVVAENIVGVGL